MYRASHTTYQAKPNPLDFTITWSLTAERTVVADITIVATVPPHYVWMSSQTQENFNKKVRFSMFFLFFSTFESAIWEVLVLRRREVILSFTKINPILLNTNFSRAQSFYFFHRAIYRHRYLM